MSTPQNDDPDTLAIPGNVGAKPALYLPKRYASENIPVYLCNPYDEAIEDVLILSQGTSLEMGSTNVKERRFARVEPQSCLRVDALDPYIDADLIVVFDVRARSGETLFVGRTSIYQWPGKEGLSFRLHPPNIAP